MYDESRVAVEPRGITLAAQNWPACNHAQMRLTLDVNCGSRHSSENYRAVFGLNGRMERGSLDTMYQGVPTSWYSTIPVDQPIRASSIDFDELRTWVALHDAEARSVRYFVDCLKSYRAESPDEYTERFGDADEDSFSVRVTEVGLFLDFFQYGFDEAKVTVRIPLVCRGVRYGSYFVDYDRSGECIDDWFWVPD